MATGTLNNTRQLPNKTEYDESGSETKNDARSPVISATSAEYFEILSRATDDAVRDWNVKGDRLAWAGAFEHLLGPAPGAAARKTSFWSNRIHPADLVRIQNSLREALNGGEERWMGEYRFQCQDGEYANILERALILRDEGGAAVRLVGTMMDVTTRRQLQAQATRSQRMEAFGQLAGGVAHDFNNFLTTILGYSDLLLSEAEVKGRIADQINEIREAAGRASTLTNQLLAFSRRQALEPSICDVNTLISNLERSLLHLLGDHISIVCQLHHLPEGAYIKVDPHQFVLVILNLAVNARDAMPQGGRLTLTTSTLAVAPGTPSPFSDTDLPDGDYVVVAISDNGTGMSEEVKARIFEPFFTTKVETPSSGLGLATTYGIVSQSGGHILVESELGHGSTFRIFFQRIPPPPPAPYKKPGSRKLATGTETILVLEDEFAVRHLAVRVLRKLGYEVLEAAHGDDAKRLITRRGAPHVDLLLADVVMPDVSGRDFADWLHLTSPATKVIFTSGYLEESLHPRDRCKPGTYFLAKPFSAEQLASKMREVLDGKH